MTEKLSGRPVVFGEVLFDHFVEDGSDVLGGAPFNVAWHLHGFGLEPLFISRIGADRRGGEVRGAMQAWGMDASGLQEDPEHPTGTVQVDLTGDQPRFDIVPEQAYDFVDGTAATGALENGDWALIYHGSLAARHPVSRGALEAVRGHGLPAFVDINLRPPWWTAERIEPLLAQGRWLKLNEDELAAVLGRELDTAELEPAAVDLRLRHGLEVLIVTLGGDGALVTTATGTWRDRPPPLDRVVDSVGAGDAFSAVSILGLMHGWDPGTTLERSMAFAGAVCGYRGATARDPALYRHFRDQWGV